jgi:hypothetical protein
VVDRVAVRAATESNVRATIVSLRVDHRRSYTARGPVGASGIVTGLAQEIDVGFAQQGEVASAVERVTARAGSGYMPTEVLGGGMALQA